MNKTTVSMAILAIFSIFFFYLAFQDRYSLTMYFFGEKTDRAEVGIVSEKTNNILRRNFGRPSYFALNAEDSIFDLDYVYSGEKSQATINLSETSSAKILEQSLVIFRLENGRKVIDLRDGQMELDLDPQDEIQIKVQKERLDVFGEEQMQLRVSSKDGQSFFEGMSDGSTQLSHGSKTYDLADGPVTMDEDGQSESLRQKAQRESEEQEQLESLNDDTRLPSGLSSGSGKPGLLKRRDLPVPYPPNQVVMFHRKGADLLVYPSKVCRGECTITLKFNQRTIRKLSFKDGESPFVHLAADANLSGKFDWTYVDFQGQRTGSFEVRKFNPTELKKAMKNSKQIEVIN